LVPVPELVVPGVTVPPEVVLGVVILPEELWANSCPVVEAIDWDKTDWEERINKDEYPKKVLTLANPSLLISLLVLCPP
jgi:hypothetical protein